MMDIAMGAMSTVLPKLADLLKEEYKLQKSVRGEIMFLETELQAMQTALVQISEAPIDQPPSRQDKRWATEVRDLSYDLEDKIDEFLVRLDVPQQLRGLRAFVDKSINLLTSANIRHKIGSDINDIKIRIREVSERRNRYKIDNVNAKTNRPSVDSLRLSAMHKKASELIGTEEKAKDIVKRLMEEDTLSDQQLKVVSIVGLGGLGKTTLAHVVYEELRGQFDCRAFVSISLNPNMDQVFKDMLRQLDNNRYKNIKGEMWDETQLINELRDFLSNKRYCIVIDDIWNKSAWATVLRALNRSGRGSKIITTTRILDVAKQTGSVYKLKPLSPVDSRKLFYLRIFGTEEKILPKELAKESENILRKCGGVPLAIITIASMLASRMETEHASEFWSKVCKSMGSGLENSSDDLKDMRSILSVSYHDLPLHLRTCFLHLSLYPEDYQIRTQDLIWKWIGEGFVLKKQGKNMFEEGEDYIHELINRSLIQPSYNGDESKKACISFKIHDMVLELITFMSTEEQFLTKLGDLEPDFLPNKIRRLSLQSKNAEDGKEFEKKNFSHVRSLTVFSEAFKFPLEHSRFPVLRVLDLTQVKVGNNNYHCKDICNLLHLRYLALPYNSITEIPMEIGKLKLLKVLDIDGIDIVELPSSFDRLKQLVYLRFRKLVTVPEWFRYLKSLQEIIGYIHLKSPAILHVLGELTELRRVSLFFEEWDESYEKLFPSWLCSMASLKYLAINAQINIDLGSRCENLSSGPQQLQTLEIRSAICSVPRWLTSLCSLSILHICLLTFQDEDLQILGSLPSLCHLAITVKERPTDARDRKLVFISAHPFICLKKFEVEKSVGVVFLEGAMEKLQSLVLCFRVRETMDHLGHFDFGLENLSSLVNVTVWMDSFNAKPEETKTAMDAIRYKIGMHPNVPKLQIDQRCVLKLLTPDTKTRSRAFQVIAKVQDVKSISADGDQGKLTVCGMVDRTTIIKKLKKKGIKAEPWDWDVRPVTTPVGTKQASTTCWWLCGNNS